MVPDTSSQTLPLVSIVIPVRNEESFIQRNLEAIFAQDYPQDKLEILALDGLSADNTRAIIESLQTTHPSLRLVDNPARFTPHALNLGLKNATGDIIIILGGHSEVASDYVSHCVAALQDHDIDAVGGSIDTIGETYQAKAIALGMSSRFGVGNVTFRTGSKVPMVVDTVVFGAYRREIVERVGLFDEDLVRNQDDEYNYRLRKLGGKLLFSPAIRSRYYSRGTLRSLFRQYYQYGYYKVQVMIKHPYQMCLRHFIPAAFVLGIVGLGLLALLIPVLGILWGSITALYLFGSLYFSFRIARHDGFAFLPIMPIVFATLHFSYGIGFLYGLFAFRRKILSLPRELRRVNQ